ncbi:MAG: hypothetical protein GSR78_02255 [Desulfurococcales archaeon]|nr:hypothetical protein [Desulfurococcales archaeon]
MGWYSTAQARKLAYTIPLRPVQPPGGYMLDPAGMAGNGTIDMMDGWCPCMMGFGFGFGGFMGILWFILMLAIIVAVVYAVIGLIRGLGQGGQPAQPAQPVQPVQPAYASSREAALERELAELRRELAELKRMMSRGGGDKS